MSAWPKISVVIPSFNQGRYIERTLASILKQDYPGAVEVLVSDGGSTDETVTILRRFGDRIAWWSEKDGGYVDAVRKGTARASGEILAIQSSDDFYLQGTFRAAAAALCNDPQLAFAGGASYSLAPSGRVHGGYRFDGAPTPRTILFEFTPRQEATFVRRSCYDDVGGLRPEVDICADKDLWYRLAHHHRGRVFPEFWAVYQQHSSQRTQSSRLWAAGVVRMIESCEADPRFGSSFRLTDAQRDSLYAWLELFWAAQVDHTEARRLATQRIAELDRFDTRTQELILRHAGFAGRGHWLRRLRHRAGALLSQLRKLARGDGTPAPDPAVLDWWRT